VGSEMCIRDRPPTITQGEEVIVTVTLYNYLEQAQTVRVELAPGEWYTLTSAPQETLTLSPNDVATATFSIRAGRAGDFSLQVVGVGERMSDVVVKEVVVEQ